MLHGCIPVVIMDNVDPVFASILDWTQFSVRIAEVRSLLHRHITPAVYIMLFLGGPDARLHAARKIAPFPMTDTSAAHAKASELFRIRWACLCCMH